MKIVTLFCLLLPMTVRAQIFSDHHYTKIVVPKGQEFTIQTDSLYLDTLILESNSKLTFLFPRTKLIVENAFISDNCLWDARGKNGENGSAKSLHGEDGENGKNLVLIIVFRELKNLSIRTNGGNGGRGFDASAGRSGLVNGGNGGIGGDGGHLELHYSTAGFIPRFNEASEHSIFFFHTGGNPGQLGTGKNNIKSTQPSVQKEYSTVPEGRVVRNEVPVATEPSGINGTPGSKGKDGQLVLKRFE